MQKILFVCNTYYQLITAMQCRNTLFTDDRVDIIFSDHSKNAEKITDKLKEMKVFDNVSYLESKKIDQGKHSKVQVFKELTNTVLGLKGYLKNVLCDDVYDELIYYNLNSSILGIYSILIKNNKEMKCSRFEEGILSYNNKFNNRGNDHYTKRIDLALKIRSTIGKSNLPDNIYHFYCFFPSYYRGQFKAVSIPTIKENDIIRTQLETLFEVTEKYRIDEKYIFFTSVYDFEGGEPIGEFEVVKQVAAIVGNDNLIVKTHPRDTRSVYQENKIKVTPASSIPWEALQLYFGYQDKVLLTATSGAIISLNMIVSTPIQSYFLFNECRLEGNPYAIETVNTLKDLMNNTELNEKMMSIHIAKSVDEIV